MAGAGGRRGWPAVTRCNEVAAARRFSSTGAPSGTALAPRPAYSPRMIGRGRVAAALTLAVLAGCTAQVDKPSALPPLPASTSPSPSPSPSPSQSAARPRGTDLQQIVALAKDYFAELNKAFSNGNTERLHTMTTATCRCLSSANYIEKQWRTGSVRAPNYYRVSNVALPKLTSRTTGFVNVIYTSGTEVDLDATGKVIHSYPADPKPEGTSLDMLKVDGIWKVADFVRN